MTPHPGRATGHRRGASGRVHLWCLLVTLLAGGRLAAQRPTPSSSAWLQLLPEGETKRRFLLDCAGCHQVDSAMTRPGGKPRTRAEWSEAVRRMLGLAGAGSSFPVMGADRDPERTAVWLDSALARREPSLQPVTAAVLGAARLREYLLPRADDTPQDVAIDSVGQVLVAGALSHRIYRLDPVTGAFREALPPVAKGAPSAVEVDSAGAWWVLLSGPRLLARYVPATGRWATWPLAAYPSTVALDPQGRAWFSGQFSRSPELIGRLTPDNGRIETFEVPPHPTLAGRPGGPIPSELRVASDGTVWGSELQGNRIFAFLPATRRFATYSLPEPLSGPCRFDVDSSGTLWIPAFAANRLIRFEPAIRRFTEYPLPLADALPYVARVDAAHNAVWIGTAAADALLRFDPASARFTVYPLPSRGTIVRQLVIDPRTGDLWFAYGGPPTQIRARVARVRVQ